MNESEGSVCILCTCFQVKDTKYNKTYKNSCVVHKIPELVSYVLPITAIIYSYISINYRGVGTCIYSYISIT